MLVLAFKFALVNPHQVLPGAKVAFESEALRKLVA